ncbi:MAG: hypothetical protein V4654_08895 [Bdellovibrionota bacterium]
MTIEIVEKLNSILKAEKFSGPVVVYLMASIRKILEQELERYKEEKITFYCNWVLHHRLSKESARLFIKQFEPLYDRLKKNSEDHSYLEAEDITKFSVFRAEMSKVLQKFNINDFTSDEHVWLKFRIEYASVVADCRLEARSNNDEDSIKKIIVNLQQAEQDGRKIFKTNWNIIPKEGIPAQFFIIDSIE